MGLIFDTLLLDTLAVMVILAIIFYINSLHSFWTNAGVPQLKPSLPFGNLGPFMRNEKSFGNMFKDLYDQMKSKGWDFGGFYVGFKGDLMVLDPDLIKCILSRDFSHFNSRGQPNFDHDPLTKHLFALPDQSWRNLRAKLSPAFTSVKMKNMFSTLLECSNELERQIGLVADGNSFIDIKDISERFTIDVIVSCAFGLDSNCLLNPKSEFRQIGKLIFDPTVIDKIKLNISYTFPKFLALLKIPLINKKISRFFSSMTEDTVSYREENNVQRKDFLQLLIEMKNKNIENRVTIKEISAQSYVFFLAGFETSSSTITFCLYELSRNADIQEKLRSEVMKVLKNNGGKITYEVLMEMNYMDKVISETLRKYPPLSFLNRQCIKDYKIPNTEITLKKGPSILISTLGIHRDPEYYPNPDKFDPERFAADEIAKRHPYTYLPFGEGPRICIGLRFGLMQIKVGLTVLLSKFRFELNERTRTPLRMSTQSFTLCPLGGMWLDVSRV